MEGADHVTKLEFKPEASNIRAKYVLAHIAVLLPMAVKSDQYGIRSLNLSAFDIYGTHVAA